MYLLFDFEFWRCVLGSNRSLLSDTLSRGETIENARKQTCKQPLRSIVIISQKRLPRGNIPRSTRTLGWCVFFFLTLRAIVFIGDDSSIRGRTPLSRACLFVARLPDIWRVRNEFLSIHGARSVIHRWRTIRDRRDEITVLSTDLFVCIAHGEQSTRASVRFHLAVSFSCPSASPCELFFFSLSSFFSFSNLSVKRFEIVRAA